VQKTKIKNRIELLLLFLLLFEGKRPHGRPRCRWKDNVKIDIQIKETVVVKMSNGLNRLRIV
jgi:hypothetical protein